MGAALTHLLPGGGTGPGGARAAQGDAQADPWQSGIWPLHRARHLGDPQDWRHDPALLVLAPEAAEDPRHVPVLVDATEVAGGVARLVVTVDYSPIPEVLSFFPGRALPLIGFGVKYETASALRASAERASGGWSIGGAYVDALGGGCTAPSASLSRPDWQTGFGEMRGRLWPGTGRLRIWLRHPQDTGLAPGVPAHHLTELRLDDERGEGIARLELHQPVEENPAFTFLLPLALAAAPVAVRARDNMGNVFSGLVEPGA